MPDAQLGLNFVINGLGAAAALGLAASGLVDTTKMFWGGVSNLGFKHIRDALNPYAAALSAAIGKDWAETLRAHWINGVPKDDQKAKAKALIRLGLSPKNAAAVAEGARVDVARFTTAIQKIQTGAEQELDKADLEVFGRFDTTIEAAIDAALERADQQYRNAAKTIAAGVAISLAVVAGGALFEGTIGDYIGSDSFGLALVVGAISVPIAPIAKDLASSLQSAVKALKSVGG